MKSSFKTEEGKMWGISLFLAMVIAFVFLLSFEAEFVSRLMLLDAILWTASLLFLTLPLLLTRWGIEKEPAKTNMFIGVFTAMGVFLILDGLLLRNPELLRMDLHPTGGIPFNPGIAFVLGGVCLMFALVFVLLGEHFLFLELWHLPGRVASYVRTESVTSFFLATALLSLGGAVALFWISPGWVAGLLLALFIIILIVVIPIYWCLRERNPYN